MNPDDAPGLHGLVGEVLRTQGAHAAGRYLLALLEETARTEPDRAAALARRLAREPVDDPVFAGWRDRACGAALHLVGDTQRAAGLLERGARRLDRAGEEEAADRCRLLLIDVFGELQEIGRARRLARRLARRFEERDDPERAGVALANLGCAEDAVDRVARAEALWIEARRRLGKDGIRGLLVEANLANVLMVRGRFEEAIHAHGSVEARAHALGLENLALQARLNRAETLFAAGRPEEAFETWHEVVREAERTGADGIAAAATLDLAAAEAEIGRIESAGRRAAALLPRLEALGLERERLKAVRLVALREALRGRTGRWRALHAELDERRLGVQRDLLLVDAAQLDPTVSAEELAAAGRRLRRAGLRVRGLVGLAWASRRALEAGDTGRAGRLAREVLDGRARPPWARLVALRTLAAVERDRRIPVLRRAVREARQLHGRLRAPSDRAAFLRTRGAVFAELVEALIERGRSRDRREALDLLSELRSAWLVEELSSAAGEEGDPLVARWNDLRRRLAVLLGELEGEDEGRLRASGLALEREVARVERELGGVEVELLRVRPGFPAAAGIRDVAGRIAARLPDGQVFLECFVGRHDLTLFVIAGGRLHVHRVPGGAWEVAEHVASLRFNLAARGRVGGAWREHLRRGLEDRLSALAALLLGPLAGREWNTLWIAPHDGLFHVPWGALPLSGGERLADRGTVTLVPGAAVCAALLEDRPEPPRSVAVLGAATGALEWVGREVEAVTAAFPGAVARSGATRGDFLEALAGADMVHLAGHALFLDGMPRASGLRMADGFVTVHDLAAARIGARVVGFGVCSGIRLGEDGARFGGFLQAMVAGGVRSVVGPITAVEDEVAYTFDVAWARGLARHGNPGRAHAEAVAALRNRDPDPAVWASFQLYGDPRGWGNGR